MEKVIESSIKWVWFDKVFYLIHSQMSRVKIQQSSESSTNDNQIGSTILSAFQKCKSQIKNQTQPVCINHIETYIRLRKNQNSFTLSEIQITNSQDQTKDSKISEKSLTQQNHLPEVINAQTQTLLPSNLKIYRVFQQHYVQKDQKIKDFRINSYTLSQIIYPSFSSQKLPSNYKLKLNVEGSLIQDGQMLLKSLNLDSESQQNIVKVEQKSKSKKQNKKQKINSKNKQKTVSGKINQQKNKQNNQTKKTPVKNKLKAQIKTNQLKSAQISDQQQFTDQIPFGGVLRNCKCCGKLITKLCFKCPHLYCKPGQCSRKKKKTLNQRMLERMKQEKIEEHYRQRELYEKMKIEQGQNFNPKLILEQIQKQREGYQRNVKRISRPKKNQENMISFSSQEFLTSEQEFDSKVLFDSSEEQDKRVSQKHKNTNNSKGKKKRHIQLKQSQKKQDKKVKIMEQERNPILNERQKQEQLILPKGWDKQDSFLCNHSLPDLQTQALAPIKRDNRNIDSKKAPKRKKLDLYFNEDDE